MRRKLRFSTESVFGVRDTAPAFTGYIPMDTADSFKPMTTRPFWAIGDGSGQNVPRLRGSEVYKIGGTLNTRAYWEHVQYLAGLAQRCSGGPPATAPWPTDQRILDLPSATIDFGYTNDDDTYNLFGYLGCKVASTTFSATNAPDNPFLNVSHELIGKEVVPNNYNADAALTQSTFADPALTVLPKNPLTFQETTFSYNGTSFNFFDQFSVKLTNKVKAYYDNGRFPNRIHCRGRMAQLTIRPLLQATAMNPRARYELVTALTSGLSITMTNSVLGVGHTTYDTLTFNFRSNSFLDSVEEQMILDEDAYVLITVTAHLDTTAGDDFDIVFTPGS